jgi:hypothetical protein
MTNTNEKAIYGPPQHEVDAGGSNPQRPVDGERENAEERISEPFPFDFVQ